MALIVARSRNCIYWSKLLHRSYLPTQKIQERNAAIRSSQFPEYSLIFDFDKIRTVCRVNRMKMQMTYFTAAEIPCVTFAQYMGLITPDTAGSCIFLGCFFTVFLHSIGFLFNNTIGLIYLSDDGNSVKISHVGYWGERVDIDTTVDQIEPLNDLPTGLLANPWYHRVCLANSKKTFKMYLTASKVLDNKSFSSIFGRIYS